MLGVCQAGREGATNPIGSDRLASRFVRNCTGGSGPQLSVPGKLGGMESTKGLPQRRIEPGSSSPHPSGRVFIFTC
jgi:hypothetical protein